MACTALHFRWRAMPAPDSRAAFSRPPSTQEAHMNAKPDPAPADDDGTGGVSFLGPGAAAGGLMVTRPGRWSPEHQ
jgi:hypothetical protein